MIIDNAGTYTLRYTATDDCGKTTTVDRELVVQNQPYGIYWDGSKNSRWTRIGKSALLADPVPQYSDGNGGWIGGSSPFDDVMPWSGMQIVEDATIGTLVSIPKYYYKWTRSGEEDEIMQLEISPTPMDGFLTSPAHADRGDGVGERDVVYVGRYHCTSDYVSQRGSKPVNRKNIFECRNGITAKGNDIWQYDFAMFWTIAMLYLVEFGDWNSQACIGYGCASTQAIFNMGATDGMTYHTGTDATGKDVPGSVQYRHIEGLWDNVRDWCDGVYVVNDGDAYCIKNPSDFGQIEDETPVGGTYVGHVSVSVSVIKRFTNPTQEGFEYALLGSQTINESYDKYVADELSASVSKGFATIGGDYNTQGLQNGLFHMGFEGYLWQRNVAIGCRLQKLPNA